MINTLLQDCTITNIYIRKKNIVLGQGPLLHEILLVEEPEQARPLWAGAGFVQVRVLPRVPFPQDCEHSPSTQLVQKPSTKN